VVAETRSAFFPGGTSILDQYFGCTHYKRINSTNCSTYCLSQSRSFLWWRSALSHLLLCNSSRGTPSCSCLYEQCTAVQHTQNTVRTAYTHPRSATTDSCHTLHTPIEHYCCTVPLQGRRNWRDTLCER